MSVCRTTGNICCLTLKLFLQFVDPGKVFFLLLFDDLFCDILFAKELTKSPEPAVGLNYSVWRCSLNLRNTEVLFKDCSKITSESGTCLNRCNCLRCVIQILQCRERRDVSWLTSKGCEPVTKTVTSPEVDNIDGIRIFSRRLINELSCDAMICSVESCGPYA